MTPTRRAPKARVAIKRDLIRSSPPGGRQPVADLSGVVEKTTNVGENVAKKPTFDAALGRGPARRSRVAAGGASGRGRGGNAERRIDEAPLLS